VFKYYAELLNCDIAYPSQSFNNAKRYGVGIP